MVHTHSDHGQEQSGGNITGNDAHDQDIAHAQLFNHPAQCGGNIAGSGHDDQDIGHEAQDHGDQRGEHDVQRFGHPLTHPALDLDKAPCAQHNGQHAAAACTQDGIQRHSLVEETQNGRDLVDTVQTGDHAQHTAQNGGAAELFGCAVADPCGQVAQEAGVHQTQQGADQSQCGDVGVVRHHLTDQGVDAGAQTGSHNARDQGDKDIAEGLEQLLDLALLLSGLDCGLVGLPVVGGGSGGVRRDAHVAADICALAALAGADHDLHIAGTVMHDAHHALDGLQALVVDLGVIFNAHPQTGHAVGCGENVALSADLLQRRADQFFIRHKWVLL